MFFRKNKKQEKKEVIVKSERFTWIKDSYIDSKVILYFINKMDTSIECGKVAYNLFDKYWYVYRNYHYENNISYDNIDDACEALLQESKNWVNKSRQDEIIKGEKSQEVKDFLSNHSEDIPY